MKTKNRNTIIENTSARRMSHLFHARHAKKNEIIVLLRSLTKIVVLITIAATISSQLDICVLASDEAAVEEQNIIGSNVSITLTHIAEWAVVAAAAVVGALVAGRVGHRTAVSIHAKEKVLAEESRARSREDDRRTLVRSLFAEVDVIIETIFVGLLFSETAESQAKTVHGTLNNFNYDVYKNNTQNLGLLDSKLAGRVVRFYASLHINMNGLALLIDKGKDHDAAFSGFKDNFDALMKRGGALLVLLAEHIDKPENLSDDMRNRIKRAFFLSQGEKVPPEVQSALHGGALPDAS